MKTKKRKKFIFHNVLVHTARTWERIRLQLPNQEMRYDNIESVDEIITIADEICLDDVIQKFINLKKNSQWDWDKETNGHGCSDTYIEALAEKLIKKLIE